MSGRPPVDMLDTHWVEGYQAGWEDAPRTVVDRPIWRRIVALVVGSFVAGLLIGRLIVPVNAATQRSAAQPVIPAGDSRDRRGAEGSPSGNLTEHPSGAPLRSPSADPPRPVQGGAPLTGIASWYGADGLIAAVPGWRWGDRPYRVRVCSGSRCVVVTVSDCLCGRTDRLIDLSDDAFRRLAPLSVGVLRVTVSRG